MKKLLLTSVILSIYSATCVAQWVTQTSPVIAELRGIYFTSSTTGYCVGSTGTIVKTQDAGNNWYQLFPQTTDTLRAVFFTDDTTGYTVGSQGAILQTLDSGSTWTFQTSNVTVLLRSVYFPTHDTGYVCGGGGEILKTTDGGANWIQQTSGITQDLINIRFNGTDTGYAVSSTSTFTGGIILKTIDGGATWNSVYTDVNYGFLALAVKGDHVYAGGYGETIVESIDAGTTWTSQNFVGSANNLRNASFLNVDTGIVVGDLGIAYSTTNGSTFTLVSPAPSTAGLLGVHYYNKDTIYCSCATGIIVRYTTPCTPPIPSVLNGNTVICSNTTQTYWINSVPGATSYVWNTPTGSVIQSGQGDTLITVLMGANSGVVSVSSANFCGQSFPANVNVTINAAPTTPSVIQTGQVLSSTASSGNQWYFNGVAIPNATAQIYQPTQNGLYTVIVTVPNGCTAISLPFNWTQSVLNEIDFIQNISVTPQPSKDFAMISFEMKKQTTVSISVFDLTGKKIFDVMNEKSLSGKQSIKIDCNNLMKGIYLLKIDADKNSGWIKLIKE